ncbi:MFS transporter [Lactococcus protaetiae]|uniref:MFS transporter n=1 Tax=Lactococcus protaetiae TaxID=2592653 RepID=A0A514Z6J9_9LACT|nr:MFS transporter [Lactococcus protaetiae]QDK70224.1 MFS transporter [Lactococcus protaetiae]
MKKYSFTFFLVMFLIGTDTFLISPLLPTLSRLYGITASLSGWLVSAYAIGYAVFALISGPFSDGRNRKKVMMFGFAGFALATFLCAFATSFVLMLIFRFLAGVAASFVTPQVWAMIPLIAPKNQVVKMIGFASSGLALAQIAGVPLGSFLATVNWRTPFVLISFCTVLLFFLVGKFLPTSSATKQANKGFISIYKVILNNKKAVNFLIGYLIFQTGNFTVFIFIGTWFSHQFHLDLSQVGASMMILGLGQFVGSTFGNKIINRLGLAKSLWMALLTLCILYLILPWLSSLVFILSFLALIFVVNGFIFPVFMALLQTTTETARSTVSSLSNAAMYAGTTLAGLIGGSLFTHFPHFLGIAYFVIFTYLIALSIYKYSGLFRGKIY